MNFLIYTPQITHRVRYIFEFMFGELMGIDTQFTSDVDDFISWHGKKLNYSKRPIAEELFIQSSNLLFQKGIQQLTPDITFYNGYKTPFPVIHEKSLLPFDVFAAAFYLITRYEEYLPFRPDAHGRFAARESMAYKNAFLKKPVINYWALDLERLLCEHYTDLGCRHRKYKVIHTYDIDIAYCYKHKGFLRNLGGFLRDIYYKDIEEVGQRARILFGRDKDPYDTYEWQKKLDVWPELEFIYFFLISDYGPYDKNISHESFYYQRLIQTISDEYVIGIHPSYASDSDINLMRKEIGLLSDITKRDILRSRQHYLKLRFPSTYQHLLECGINKDYTMGYADEIGFRASVASSFWFYDLCQENKTRLRIYPFYIMDVTLQHYMQLAPQEAIHCSDRIIDEVKSVNGLMITLWHNHSLSEHKEWKNWRAVYEHIVGKCNEP